MKVLYFYQYFTSPKGAWGTRVYEFARRWAKDGDQVTIVTSVYDKSDLQVTGLISRQKIEGIHVIVINLRLSNRHGFLARLGTFFTYAILASWFALTERTDIVVASSGPISVGLPGLVAKYLRGRKFIFEVRDLWPENAIQFEILKNKLGIWLARRFEMLCYRSADRVVALSDGMKEWIDHRINNSEKVVSIPNASDNQMEEAKAWTLPEWAKGKRLALYTGTLGLANDCRMLLDLGAVLKSRGREDIEIVILGDGKERAELEAEARLRGLNNIHFLGLVSRIEVAEWLRRACCALLVFKPIPVASTNSPNKMFDAFAAGVPVVQTTSGWIRKLFEEENCGISVAPYDAIAMADAVTRLASDRDFHAELSKNSKRVAQERFDRDLLSQKMRSVIYEVAKST